MRARTAHALGLLAATCLLTACGSPATTLPSAAPSTTTPAPSDDTGVPFPSGTGRQLVKHRGAWDLVLRDVRVGTHDGFDRVVVEFEGSGTPGWGAEYVTTPRADGSGKVVDVSGDSYLAVSISGVTIRQGYPRTPADFFHGARHFAPADGGAIEDVSVGGVFEGYSQLFLGIDGEKVPFRVFALANPPRLVVDVESD